MIDCKGPGEQPYASQLETGLSCTVSLLLAFEELVMIRWQGSTRRRRRCLSESLPVTGWLGGSTVSRRLEHFDLNTLRFVSVSLTAYIHDEYCGSDMILADREYLHHRTRPQGYLAKPERCMPVLSAGVLYSM